MAESNSPVPARPAASGDPPEAAVIEALTRGGYKRLPATERQITDAINLDTALLVDRARQKDETAPGYLSAEALVYFIRRAHRSGDTKTRDKLFRDLFERCSPYFRGQFRGFTKEEREDLQCDLMKGIVEDIYAPDDRGDFMQVRFWKYLDNKRIDACRKTFRHSGDTESLDANFSDEGESARITLLETQADNMLSPEQLAMLSDALAKLPPRLRRVFLLRHYVGMKIGEDDPAKNAGEEMTIAQQYGCSGRTIRNWLKEAERLLGGFREKNDGE